MSVKFVKLTEDSFFSFQDSLVFTEACSLNYCAEKILGGHSQSSPALADREVIHRQFLQCHSQM